MFLQKKLTSGQYSSAECFVGDIKFIIKTSSESEEEEICQKGQELEKIFQILYSSSYLGSHTKSSGAEQKEAEVYRIISKKS